MELPLPVADSVGEPIPLENPRLTINVLKDGALMLAGRRLDREDLPGRLRERLAEEGEQLEVRVRSDRRVPYENVEPILLACARAGIWNVTFAVFRTEDAR
jgi:biopolymer transport protein ExbD